MYSAKWHDCLSANGLQGSVTHPLRCNLRQGNQYERPRLHARVGNSEIRTVNDTGTKQQQVQVQSTRRIRIRTLPARRTFDPLKLFKQPRRRLNGLQSSHSIEKIWPTRADRGRPIDL